jgi:GT2 family glycosyltransferase
VLSRCLDSLEGQEGVSEIVVVDNGGGGPEIEDARSRDGVKVVVPGRNVGFAAGCNLGARETDGDVLVFLNPDTVVAPGAIAQLAATLDDPEIGIAMARLRLLDRPELLSSRGTEVHLAGIAWAGGYGDVADDVDELRDIAGPSGVAMAIHAQTFRELGGFTKELFMYREDLLLGWKARLAGLRVVIDPQADVFHDYDNNRNVDKHYLLERNRLVFVLSSYSGRMLLLLGPVLVALELGLAAQAAREGWFRDKVRGWAWCARHAGWLRRQRRTTQGLRAVSDRDLAAMLTPTLSPATTSVPGVARGANRAVEAYWRIARRGL